MNITPPVRMHLRVRDFPPGSSRLPSSVVLRQNEFNGNRSTVALVQIVNDQGRHRRLNEGLRVMNRRGPLISIDHDRIPRQVPTHQVSHP